MRPPWPRLALRSLVRGGPVWPYFRLRWPRQEWPGVAKLLIQLHSVAFGCIAYPPNPHPDPLPEGEGTCRTGGRGCEVPPRSRERRKEPVLHADGGAIPGVERSSGVHRSGKLLIQSHLVAFRLIPYRLRGGLGCEVPAFAGTTGGFAETTHVTNVRAGAAAAQWAVVVGLAFGAGVLLRQQPAAL